MEKLNMETKDWTSENVEKIGALFPQAITEARGKDGALRKVINFDVLKQLLSSDVLPGDEAYEFTWVGKKAAMVEAGKPIRKTLRPCKEESKDWDNTENLYIEGDNLDVLKLLQESYLGKVKLIYIDPPYNTGKDFIYNDRFMMNKEDYQEQTGLFDDDEHKNFKENTDSNPRFHSDWCSMMYPRLQLARNLLSEDGAIIISIDDNEQDNLKKICNEIFGETNYIATVAWQRTYAPISLKKFFSESHEYGFVYSKNKHLFEMNLLPRSEKQNKDYKNPDNDPRGVWKIGNLTVGPAVEKQVYEIVGPTGKSFLPPSGYCWRFTREKFQSMLEDNRIWFGADGSNSPVPKLFLSEVQDGVTPMTLWTFQESGHNQESTREVRSIFNGTVFTNPKPLRYITRYLQIASNPDSIVLDFFSGSATTAHAVMQLNAEDGGKRKFIMVQLPELTDVKSEAYKAGYKNICEIGKERIRRAGEKIKSEIEAEALQPGLTDAPKQVPDIGFRVLKLADSNMKDVYYNPQAYDQEMISGLESNIKEDRNDLDLLFGCLLEWGLPLSMPYTSEQIEGITVHTYNEGDLVACFDENIPETVVKQIASRQPLRAVFRDGSFSSSPEKINVAEIFKLLAPNTHVKVL